MINMQCKVLSRKTITEKVFVLELEGEGIARRAQPGQFIHLKCGENLDFILRRPFSIHQVRKRSFDILVQIVGRGSTFLSQLEIGAFLDVMGPLGKEFEVAENLKEAILVGGGIGIAPLFFLAKSLLKPQIPRLQHKRKKPKLTFFLGAPSKKDILRLPELESMNLELHIATEDHSLGYPGLVTGAIEEYIGSNAFPESRTIFACGPELMLKKVSEIAKKHRIRTQISMERFFACGIGACLSCVCKTKDGYKRVCVDGPVFNAYDIVWSD